MPGTSAANPAGDPRPPVGAARGRRRSGRELDGWRTLSLPDAAPERQDGDRDQRDREAEGAKHHEIVRNGLAYRRGRGMPSANG